MLSPAAAPGSCSPPGGTDLLVWESVSWMDHRQPAFRNHRRNGYGGRGLFILAFWKMQHIMWHSVALPEVRGLAMLDGLL